MASVNWQKMTKQKVCSSGMKAHMENSEREKRNHSNPDIDKDKTNENYCIGCSSWQGAVNRLNQRNNAVDKVLPPQRVRKDRVYGVSLEYPCPRELTDQGRSDEFFQKSHDFISQYFGSANVHGSFIHKDEVHDYVDKDGYTKTSCEHASTLVSPYVEGKGINGNLFETKARLHDFNEKFHEMVKREFGIEYNTHETAGHKTVEQLKQMETSARLSREIEDKTKILEEMERDISANTKYLSKIKPKLFSKEKDGFQMFSVTEVNGLQEENQRLRKIVEQVEIKERYSQKGAKEYYSAIVEKYQLESERKELMHDKAVFEQDKLGFEREVERKLEQAIQIGFNKALAMIKEFLSVRGLVKEFNEYVYGQNQEKEIDGFEDRV